MTRAADHDGAFYNDLDGALDEIWRRLGRAVVDRRSAMRTVQLATLGEDGGPRLRTLVLRGASRGERLLRMHTDRLSPKAAQLVRDGRAELCAYDPGAKIQIRARGDVTAHLGDSVAAAAWAETQPGSRICYRAAFAPGAALEAPGAADPRPAAQSPEESDAGFDRFTALALRVERLDWLYLAARGHRRAIFLWEEGAWRGGWRAP